MHYHRWQDFLNLCPRNFSIDHAVPSNPLAMHVRDDGYKCVTMIKCRARRVSVEGGCVNKQTPGQHKVTGVR